jgi:F420 biosynthesis protein FbiB-like protein
MDRNNKGHEGMNYDGLLALIRSRRSIRRFTERPVSRDDLDRLLEAARWAPSNHNRQPWRFLVFEDRAVIQKLAGHVRQGVTERLRALPFAASAYADELVQHGTVFSQAPVLIVAFHKQPVSVAASVLEGIRNPTLVSGEPLSVAMAIQNLLLAAHALGLGACVLTAPLLAQDELSGALPVPVGFDPTCFIALGHPDESPPAPRRKSLELIAEFRDPPCTDDENRRGDP